MNDPMRTQTCPLSFWGRIVGDQNGATAIEYALIAGGISIVIVATVNGLGSEVVNLFASVVNSF